MRIAPYLFLVLALVATAVHLTGCGEAVEKAQDAVQQAHAASTLQSDLQRLRELGAAYHNHIDSTQKGPANWQELKQSGGNSAALQELETEGCVVIWGKTFQDATMGTSEYVIAYLPKALESGGAVGVLDGAVLQMTADELKQKLVAQGATP